MLCKKFRHFELFEQKTVQTACALHIANRTYVVNIWRNFNSMFEILI